MAEIAEGAERYGSNTGTIKTTYSLSSPFPLIFILCVLCALCGENFSGIRKILKSILNFAILKRILPKRFS